jgi:hypothetical protein
MFGDFVDRIYPIELEIKNYIYTDRSASYLDLHLEIDSERLIYCFLLTILTAPRCRDRRGRMVVGFTITCAFSAYRHSSCEFQPRSWRSLSMTCTRSVVFARYYISLS